MLVRSGMTGKEIGTHTSWEQIKKNKSNWKLPHCTWWWVYTLTMGQSQGDNWDSTNTAGWMAIVFQQACHNLHWGTTPIGDHTHYIRALYSTHTNHPIQHMNSIHTVHWYPEASQVPTLATIPQQFNPLQCVPLLQRASWQHSLEQCGDSQEERLELVASVVCNNHRNGSGTLQP